MNRRLLQALLCLFTLSLTLASCGSRKGLDKTLGKTVKKNHYVVVLSMDGFRADYTDSTETPSLDFLAQEGTYGAFRPSYPTLTFPNHYAMATGLYPNNHGIVANEFWDPQHGHYKLGDRKSVENPVFYKGEPIWETAHKQGLKTASYFWVGSETKINGYQPDIWKRYNASVPYTVRADSVIRWLELPEKDRPQLIMWYLDEPDHTGHTYSPEAKETRDMVRHCDSVVGYFLQKLEKLPIKDQVDFLVVADHGMATYTNFRSVNVMDYVPEEWLEHVSAGPFTHVYPKEGYYNQVLIALERIPHVKVYKKEELPERLHYGKNDRTGAFILMANKGTQIYAKKGVKFKERAGAHGYDNALPEMLAIFRAYGPSFEKGRKIAEPIPNITLYTLICQLLGLKPAPVDADMDLAKSLLKANNR